ncbi:MAG: efflux RND transporter periplasmic adaptor subunit, partial [Oscillospiraceae bacterium]|nr:efflux RND transporter periplasmic adaptor subunit [Oscillospiraceae bacterium]
DGFMLGQHILIEMDNGQEDTDKKQGLWIYSSFVLWDGDRTYVWAKNSKDQIEKRYIEIGTVNDEAGDCEILSGLTIDDYIAFPSDYIEPGMTATTNQSDKNIPDNVINELPGEGNVSDEMDMPEGMENMEGFEFPEGAEISESAESPEDTEMPADNGSNEIKYDDDGNMIYDDGSGNVLKFDEDGNLIEGGDQLFGGEKAENASAAN